MKYFAYGSNMSFKRLETRLQQPKVIGVYRLTHHRLAFHKESLDGSAKCDAFYTGKADDKILGVVYDITPADKQKLDKIEGVGAGYEIKTATVTEEKNQTQNNRKIPVFLYYATQLTQTCLPYEWYQYHVIAGAHEAGLSRDYIRQIAQSDCATDPNLTRHQKELSIYTKNLTRLSNRRTLPSDRSEDPDPLVQSTQSGQLLTIRRVLPGEALKLWQLFFNTIHQINIRDYSPAQVDAWAPQRLDESYWNQRIRVIHPFVLLLNEEIVGYADIQSDGYIDHFFCHHEHQGKGLGTLLFNHLLTTAKKKQISQLYTHASETAKPFFIKRGFTLIEPQTVQVRGQTLTNYILQKDLSF